MTVHNMQFPTTRQDVEGGYLITDVPSLAAGYYKLSDSKLFEDWDAQR